MSGQKKYSLCEANITDHLISLTLGTTRFSPEFADAFVAPKLSALTACGAKPVADLPNYAGSLLLNHIFGHLQYPRGMHVLLLTFIRRLSTAIKEYNLAQMLLLDYVNNLPDNTRHEIHRDAVTHIETAILQFYIALTALVGISKIPPMKDNGGLFKKDDNSDYDRLRKVNDSIKHFDKDVAAATSQCRDIPLSPIWLSNSAVRCADAEILKEAGGGKNHLRLLSGLG